MLRIVLRMVDLLGRRLPASPEPYHTGAGPLFGPGAPGR